MGRGRPKGSKDKQPRKSRNDKGVLRVKKGCDCSGCGKSGKGCEGETNVGEVAVGGGDTTTTETTETTETTNQG